MTDTDATSPAERADSDRRFLPRAIPGRREEDLSRTKFFGADTGPKERHQERRPLFHLFVLSVTFVVGLSFIILGNVRFAALLFFPPHIEAVGKVLASGMNYATFDLNIESRRLRHAHIANLPRTPEVAVLGASHWQEAHAGLVPERDFYNAHVHRDYYEDVLAVTEMFVRNNRLPAQMIITIRDNLFTPVEARTDYLWIPAIPYYWDMAQRLDLQSSPWVDAVPLPQIQAAISLSELRANFSRWTDAEIRPHVTAATKHNSLDILLLDGSIAWSHAHDAFFTAERARQEALAFAAQRRNDPPRIDPRGVAAIDRLLEFLQDRGVEIYLAHPPFNPVYYDALRGTPYMDGLARIEGLTRSLAEKYGIQVIGSFNPHTIGCREEMYIDAEHSNPKCLQKVLDEYRALAGSPLSPS